MPPTRATRVLKTKVICWIWLMTVIAIQIRVATGGAPLAQPGKGPWLLHWRLLAMAYMSISLGSAIHILRHVDSWTEAQRADWTLAGLAALAPFNNLVCFFLLPTFDVTQTTWPALVVFHMLLGGLLLHLPPMHVLVQLCTCLPVLTFLDFQKACSLARSSQQLSLDDGRCPHGVAPRYILHQGLPMLLLGVAAAVFICTILQSNNRQEVRKALPTKITKNNQEEAAQPEDPDSAPPAVPLESLGIYLHSALGLRPLLLFYHSCIMRLASRMQRSALGAACLLTCSYYIMRTIVSRFESKPFHISAEEVLVLIICSYVVGRDASKMDMSGFLQHIQSQLLACQALLVDVLPAHLVTRMLNSMEDTQQQGQQGQQGQQQQGQQQQQQQRQGGRKTGWEGRQAPAATYGQPVYTSGPPVPRTRRRASTTEQRVSSSGQRVSSSGQRARPSPPWRRRPSRRASSLLLLRRAAAEQRGIGAEAETQAAAYPEPPESWAQGQEDAPLGPSILESWEGGDSSMDQAAAAQLAGPSEAPPPAHQAPSLYTAFSHTLSSSLWTLPSQLANHLSGGSFPSSHVHQTEGDQVQALLREHSGVLSGRTTAASHECVTLYFSDICGFSSWASKLPPEMVMSTLDDLYSRLDDLILVEFPGLYKVETVGDAYIVAANLLTPDPHHAATAVHFALRAQQEAHKVLRPDRDDGETLEMRIGLHSGSIMSGIVGKIRRRFCLFGDTMNMAARTESSCPKGSIQLTAATYTLAEPSLRGEVSLRERGEVQVKGSDKPLMMFLASAPQHPQQGLTLPEGQGWWVM